MKRYHAFVVLVGILYFVLPPILHAQQLSLNTVLQQAIGQSYDLKITQLDIEISEKQLVEARKEYYPGLSVKLTQEYLHDIGDDAYGSVAVGDTVISGNESSYQQSVGLYADMLLYNFGARGLGVKIAVHEIEKQRMLSAQALIDLKQNILELYTTCLKLDKRREVFHFLVNQKKEIFQLNGRLQKAGTRGKNDVLEAAMTLAETIQEKDDILLEFKERLRELAFFTGKTYRAEDTRFEELAANAPETIDVAAGSLPEIRAYDLEIQKKELEYKMARRQMFPTISLYSDFQMYGADYSSYTGSIEDIAAKNITAGIVVTAKLFDGFALRARIQRLKKEAQRVRLERDRQLAKLSKSVETLQIRAGQFQGQKSTLENYKKQLILHATHTQRLSRQEILDRIAFLNKSGEHLKKELEMEEIYIDETANLMYLDILAKGTMQ